MNKKQENEMGRCINHLQKAYVIAEEANLDFRYIFEKWIGW